MNEIDPAANSNGVVTSDTHQQASSSSSANKSPLLSSLLTSSKPESATNGQQNKVGQLGMMPTPAISSTPNYDESNAFMTKLTTESNESVSELDLSATNSSQKKFNNLSDILQRNNNNNKTKTVESTAKSILENCLLKPSPHKTQRLESQIYPNMEEGEYHHPSTSSVLKFGHPADDHRKVEPLKINLNREPIRTVIKLPQSHPYESPSKMASKTPQQHQERAPVTISPTLSSSSSMSSESSSFENCSDNGNNQRASSIQVIPKLHIRNVLEGTLNHEQSELHIVPKLTITGLNSPQSAINSADSPCQQQQQSLKDHSVNSILETSPTIPKLTIKKDNNSDYHLNNDVNSIPKLHIKTNHHQTKDAKLSTKNPSEPPVPKLTIKTTENDAMIVSASDNAMEQQNTIPKFTIKSNLQSTPKLTIKPVVRPVEEQEESIPKLTLKAVNNSEAFEKIVPKLVVKVPKEASEEELESTSYSSTPSPPPIPKLSIKPIPSQEKEVPKLSKSSADASLPDMKFSINRLIGAADTTADENDDYEPLEINTISTRSTDSGQDSPRIILKINKSNSESITSEIIPQPTTENAQKAASNHKRVHASNDSNEDLAKKPKLNHKVEEMKEDVILINDSDTSSSDALSKNQQSAAKANDEEKLKKHSDASTNMSGALQRNLRQSRRKAVLATPVALDKGKNHKEDTPSAAELDPLASNDTSMNSNSHVDDLVTPKRGRGRPKKIVEKVQVVDEETKDPLEVPVEEPQETEVNDDNAETKKISGRGRGRGRGRSKRTVEVMKNGKPIQITLEGHDDDDSPSFSLYNRTLKAGFGSGIRKGRGGRVGRGKGFRSSFLTPDRSKDGIFTSPPEQNIRRKTFNTPSLYEEDTRMSIGCDSSQATPVRYSEMQSAEESQSSLLSSASNTVEGSVKKRQKKTEASEAEG